MAEMWRLLFEGSALLERSEVDFGFSVASMEMRSLGVRVFV